MHGWDDAIAFEYDAVADIIASCAKPAAYQFQRHIFKHQSPMKDTSFLVKYVLIAVGATGGKAALRYEHINRDVKPDFNIMLVEYQKDKKVIEVPNGVYRDLVVDRLMHLGAVRSEIQPEYPNDIILEMELFIEDPVDSLEELL